MIAPVFAVGDRVALSGPVPDGAGAFELHAPRRVGEVLVEPAPGGAALEVSADGVDAQARLEALRLAARVLQKSRPELAVHVRPAGPDDAEALHADGFAPEPGPATAWTRPPGPYPRFTPAADDAEGVYAEPLSIPWNLVPAEFDAYAPLLAGPPCRVLEIGCGHGKNARVLVAAGHEVVGIELAASAVERCERHLGHLAAFEVADAAALPFADGSFDAVVDVGCLHCMPDAERRTGAREARRVLRSGGLLLSRIFKPRPTAWVRAQPFRADRFGLSDAAVEHLLEDLFSVERWKDDPDMHFLRCTAGEGRA